MLNKIIGNTCFAQSFTKFDESLTKTQVYIIEFQEVVNESLPVPKTTNPHRNKSGKIRRR